MPDLHELVALFFERSDQLGEFYPIVEAEMPETPRALLAHHEHMTVTVESHHESAVRVQVLQTLVTGHHYAREILLHRVSDDQVVQYGIVRLDMRFLAEEVRREITEQTRPLGRILIDHDVLREVECVALWRVELGGRLSELFSRREGETTYGRTALIHCNGAPAVELLEIVTL